MIHRIVCGALLTIICVFVTTTAQAVLVFETKNGADPTSNGFTQTGTATGLTSDSGPPLNWRMTTTASGAQTYTYPITLADLGDASGWTLTVKMKLNAADRNYESALRIRDGSNRFELLFRDGLDLAGGFPKGAFYVDDTNTAVALGTVDPTDGFHEYKISFDPKGPGTSDDETSWYVDGIIKTTQLRSGINLQGGTASFFFGKGTGGANNADTDQQYALVRLETGNGSVVPEASSAMLLGLVGLLLGACKLCRVSRT